MIPMQHIEIGDRVEYLDDPRDDTIVWGVVKDKLCETGRIDVAWDDDKRTTVSLQSPYLLSVGPYRQEEQRR